jgi:hypothetical protein
MRKPISAFFVLRYSRICFLYPTRQFWMAQSNQADQSPNQSRNSAPISSHPHAAMNSEEVDYLILSHLVESGMLQSRLTPSFYDPNVFIRCWTSFQYVYGLAKPSNEDLKNDGRRKKRVVFLRASLTRSCARARLYSYGVLSAPRISAPNTNSSFRQLVKSNKRYEWSETIYNDAHRRPRA